MNKNIPKIIILWFLADATIWLFFYNFITNTSFELALLYFLVLSVLCIFLFRNLYREVIDKTRKKDILLIIGIFTLHLLTYWVCHRYLTAPLELMKHSTASFIQVDRYFIFIKPIDVLLQQLMLIILMTKLHENKISMRAMALLLGVLFGIAHLASVERIDLNITLVMTFATTIFALFMPNIFFKLKNGYLYNFMIHILLVDLAALMYWGVWV